MEFTDLSMFSTITEVAGQIVWWENLLKMQLQHQLAVNTLQGWGNVLQDAVYALNQHPIYSDVSPTTNIHMSRNEGVKMGAAPFLITSTESQKLTFASCPCDFSSLEALVPKEGMFPLGDTIISLNYDLRLPPGHFGLLCLKSIGD